VKDSHALELMSDNKKTLVVCLTFLVAFFSVLLFKGYLREFDLAVNSWVATMQSDWATTATIGISYAFDFHSLLFASLVIASYLFYKNHGLQSLLLLGAMGGDAVLVAGFKSLVQSPRPTSMGIVGSGDSFPSGHTVGSIVFCGLIAYFAWQHLKTTRPRAVVIALAVSITSVVGFDRLYLNVHWFSDVVGGCFLGLFWLAFTLLIFGYVERTEKFQDSKLKMIAS
jgi:membrane-associated phospholipid phosphatase